MLALLGAACSDKSPKLVPYRSAEEIAEVFDEKVVFVPRADILFVIDNSGSMGSYHTKMIQNLGSFIDELVNFPFLDFQIAILTSENNVRKTPVLWGNPNVVNKNTPDYQNVLKKIIQSLGTSGDSTEKFFGPLTIALTPPYSLNQNKGFLRPDAVLAPIFITDTTDQSRTSKTVAETLATLIKLKNNRSDRIVAYGALIPASLGNNLPAGCRRDDGPSVKLEELITKTGGSFFNICTDDYGKKLTQIAEDIVMKSGGFVKLKSRPIIDTIEVLYGGVPIENHSVRGWSYDPHRVGIRFGIGLKIPTSKLPPNPELEVNFKSAISNQ